MTTIVSFLVVSDVDMAVSSLAVALLLVAGGAKEVRLLLLLLLFFAVAQAAENITVTRQRVLWPCTVLATAAWAGESVFAWLVWLRVGLTVLSLGLCV